MDRRVGEFQDLAGKEKGLKQVNSDYLEWAHPAGWTVRKETRVELGQNCVECDNSESSFHLKIALSQHQLSLCVRLN